MMDMGVLTAFSDVIYHYFNFDKGRNMVKAKFLFV